MDAFRKNEVPDEATAKQIAEDMILARRSKAEIWQELVGRKVDADMATAVVQMVAERHEVACSDCGASALRSDTTLSPAGDPICPACAQQHHARALYQRATEAASTEDRARQCRRCGRSMVCVEVETYRIRFQTVTMFTFQCRSCSHRFTGYEGTLPATFIVVACGVAAITWGQTTWDAERIAKLAACLAVILFLLYRYLVWLRYPALGWDGGPE
ncbi:hypothetical protein [Polyangium sp. 15x6]|uniref:hypothetical protein n=1 Tax=Polyangium sp. 15x6 TaxID=3042687 RepID=UPI00249C3289|nr:hypothetical protein [Polyangium sp. 15x6]MDI3286796.1 hypothetical protein [Polyangium sp. 15x6]